MLTAFAAFVELGDHLLEHRLACGGLGDGFELFPEAQLDRALEAHAAELPSWPGDGEQRVP